MATLIDWSQLETKIQSYEELYDCDDKPIALAYIILEYLLSLSPEEIRDAITDGPMDRGIDAVFVDERGGKDTVHLFQFKYTSKFENAKNNFPSSEIDKLLSFVADLLSKDPNLENTCNPILWGKIQEIWAAFERGTPSFFVHLCSNMDGLVSTEYDRFRNSLAPYRYFEIRQHTLETVASLIIEKKRHLVDGEVHLVDKEYFERVDGNIKGLIATLPATELVRLIQDPDDHSRVLTDIFNDNVRVYLTPRIRSMIRSSSLPLARVWNFGT